MSRVSWAIEEMDVVYQKEKLTMGWCINCHRDSKIDLDNPYYHGYNDWIEKHKKADLTVEDIMEVWSVENVIINKL